MARLVGPAFPPVTTGRRPRPCGTGANAGHDRPNAAPSWDRRFRRSRPVVGRTLQFPHFNIAKASRRDAAKIAQDGASPSWDKQSHCSSPGGTAECAPNSVNWPERPWQLLPWSAAGSPSPAQRRQNSSRAILCRWDVNGGSFRCSFFRRRSHSATPSH
jgi:hypothetical protein